MAYSDRTSRLEKMRNDRYADRPPLAIRYRETKRPLLPAQSRAARGLFDWSQQQLADAALVDVVTVRQFEGNATQPLDATPELLRRALENAGVIAEENGGRHGVKTKGK